MLNIVVDKQREPRPATLAVLAMAPKSLLFAAKVVKFLQSAVSSPAFFLAAFLVVSCLFSWHRLLHIYGQYTCPRHHRSDNRIHSKGRDDVLGLGTMQNPGW